MQTLPLPDEGDGVIGGSRGSRGFGHARRDSIENARRATLMGVGGRLDRWKEGRRF